MTRSFILSISDMSLVGEARRLATNMSKEVGLSDTDSGRAGILATEIATNLFKHTTNGNLLIRALFENQHKGLEILAIDSGPGIPDVQRCMQDGFSTAGTPGNGLGSIKRLSTFFDLYSTPQGTVLVSQIWPQGFTPSLLIGAISIPYPGETLCGDAWALREKSTGLSIVVADGLGHGLHASEASKAAIQLFEENQNDPPAFLLQRMHQALRSTRGAAVMTLETSYTTGQITCSGAGNIAGTIVHGITNRSLVSLNGTVGHQVSKFQEFSYPWPSYSLLILQSDGIQTRWKFDAYPGILARHPSLIAAILFRDFRREKDDVTVIVIREKNPLK